jgi:hypothetical protein
VHSLCMLAAQALSSSHPAPLSCLPKVICPPQHVRALLLPPRAGCLLAHLLLPVAPAGMAPAAAR